MLLAASPVRPRGLAVGLVVAGVLVPLAALSGVRIALGLADQPDVTAAARLAGLGAPVLVVMLLFLTQVILGPPSSGGRQLVVVVVGVMVSAALAARFTGPIDDG